MIHRPDQSNPENSMFNLKASLGALIQVLTVVSRLTASTIDDQILSLLKALDASDPFLNVLQAWIDKTKAATMPDTALPMIDPSDATFAAAFNASPALQEWSRSQVPDGVPPGAEAIGIGSVGTVLTVIKLLPTIIALLKSLKGLKGIGGE